MVWLRPSPGRVFFAIGASGVESEHQTVIAEIVPRVKVSAPFNQYPHQLAVFPPSTITARRTCRYTSTLYIDSQARVRSTTQRRAG